MRTFFADIKGEGFTVLDLKVECSDLPTCSTIVLENMNGYFVFLSIVYKTSSCLSP